MRASPSQFPDQHGKSHHGRPSRGSVPRAVVRGNAPGGFRARGANARDIAPLVSGYYEVVMSSGGDDRLELAVVASRACDLQRLQALACAVLDPAPWGVFLRVLAAVPPGLRTAAVADAFAHLYAVAIEMLRAQGLGLVRPEDLLRAPSPFELALMPPWGLPRRLNITPTQTGEPRKGHQQRRGVHDFRILAA